MHGPSKRGAELGPIGDKIIFENERVRVWSVKLDPGERQAWHQHHLPYLIVPMTEGKNVMYFEDGRDRRDQEVPGRCALARAGAAARAPERQRLAIPQRADRDQSRVRAPQDDGLESESLARNAL